MDLDHILVPIYKINKDYIYKELRNNIILNLESKKRKVSLWNDWFEHDADEIILKTLKEVDKRFIESMPDIVINDITPKLVDIVINSKELEGYFIKK